MTVALDSYIAAADRVLELAISSKFKWNGMNGEQKVGFLRAILWNPRITGSTIEYEMKKPFQILSRMASDNLWGGVPDLKQTFFPPLQLTKIVQVSEPELYKDQGFLHQKYVVERLSISEISALIFSSRTVVSKYLKLFGIPLRANDVVNKNETQLRYGEAWKKRQVTIHKVELENLEKMRKLREQGFSYWKIADILNSIGIKTKTGKGKWHSRSVYQVLKTPNIEVP